MRIYISHSSSFDFENKLYHPLRYSNLAENHSLFFPRDIENLVTKSNSHFANFDFFLAEVSFPSTGQGIELGWANCLGKPIVCIYRKGARLSSMLHKTVQWLIEYESLEDMIYKVNTFFEKYIR